MAVSLCKSESIQDCLITGLLVAVLLFRAAVLCSKSGIEEIGDFSSDKGIP